MLRRSALVAMTLALCAALTAGCAGRKVRKDFEARQTAEEALTRDVEVAPITDGPYHLALRLGAPAIEAMVAETVAPRLAEIDPAAMGAGLGGDAGAFAEAMQLSRLSLGQIEVSFPGDTDGILRARVRLEGRMGVQISKVIELAQKQINLDKKKKAQLMGLLEDLQAGSGKGGRGGRSGRGGGGRLQELVDAVTSSDEVRWMNIAPEVTVRVFMGAEVVDGRPALVMELREVESFSLNLDSPLQLPGLIALVEEVGRQRIAATLTAQGPETRRSIPLPDGAGKGDLPIRLLGIGLKVKPGADGEVFLGIATNLNVQPGLTDKTDLPSLSGAGWALTIPEGTLGLLMRTMARQGKIPLRYDRNKEPNPEGPIVVEPETLSLGDDSFVLGTRIWNLKAPAFWRHFDISGSFQVDRGQLKPVIENIDATDEGKGNMWAAGLVEKKQAGASESMVSSAGKKTRPSLPLPMTGGKRVLELDVERAVTTQGALTLTGSVEIKDAP